MASIFPALKGAPARVLPQRRPGVRVHRAPLEPGQERRVGQPGTWAAQPTLRERVQIWINLIDVQPAPGLEHPVDLSEHGAHIPPAPRGTEGARRRLSGFPRCDWLYDFSAVRAAARH